MTLLDFPGRVACTVFLGGCDLRCPFCHNFELVDGTAEPVMDDEDLLRFLEKRRGLLDGVAVTGGEPCLHRELPALLRRIRALGFKVKLDTNGFHPDMLRLLLEEGLVDYVAMDIKNSRSKYAQTAGLAEIDTEPVGESIAILQDFATRNSGFEHEFRTTVVKELHEAADFEEIGRMIEGAERYFLQSFTDRETVPFGGLHAPSPQELRSYAQIMRRYVLDVQVRGAEV